MGNTEFIAILALVGSGFYCVGWIIGHRHDLHWRLLWIDLEHKLARLEQREPKNISEVEP